MFKKIFLIFFWLLLFTFVFPFLQHWSVSSFQSAQASQSLSGVHADISLTQEEVDFLRQHPVIRVGNEDDWPPFDFSRHGEPHGYAIEHLELLGERLGISFEYINGYTWAELLQLFREDKIDLLPSLWYSDERAEYMLFTEPFLVLPYVIVTHRNDESINNFEDLKGKTVAVASGYVQESVLKQHFPEIHRYQVVNVLEGLRAVSYGHADAYIGYHGSVSYLMTTNFLYDLKVVGETRVPELGPQGLYISVRKDMAPLRDIMQKAMDSIPENEKIRLGEKWFSIEDQSRPQFSAQEIQFLLDNPVLTVSNLKHWAPFNFNENGQPRGFVIDYMDLLAQKMGIEFRYISGPTWNEFLSMLQTKEIDILGDVVRTDKREHFILFTEPYFNLLSGIVVRRGEEDDINELSDLKGKTVAVPKDFYYHEILEYYFPEINILALDNPLSCLDAVSSGRADAALSEKPVFDYLINRYLLMDLVNIPILETDVLGSTPVSVGVHHEQELLHSILHKTMNVITREEISSLRDQWFRTEQAKDKSSLNLSTAEMNYLDSKDSIRLCVNPSWQPFEEIRDNNHYDGMVAGIMQMMEERINVPFYVQAASTWEESITLYEQGECDILTIARDTGLDQGAMLLSKPYLESLTVLVSRDQHTYIPDLSSIVWDKLAVVQGDPIKNFILTNYPEIETVVFETLEQALRGVSKREADIAIGNMHLVSSKIHEMGLYDLKIAGQTPYKEFFRVGVSPEQPELLNIIDKAIDDLSSQEINSIVRQWISIRYEQGIDYALVWQIGVVASFLVAFFLYWNRKLFRLNREIADAHRDLAVKTRELEKLSITDSLTGVYNRMKIERILDNEILRVNRSREPLSIILLDIDNFKGVNDEYGHQAGDMVLQRMSALLQDNIRRTDSLGRWGGEEFMVVCPHTDYKGAWNVAEKLRLKIMCADFGEVGKITGSFGVSEFVPGEHEDALLRRADDALYKAKNGGRNRTEIILKDEQPKS